MTQPSPTKQVETWLAALDKALTGRDAAAAAKLFGDECYWRDLVAFTWNIKTCESRDDIRRMLEATLARVNPFGWTIRGEATEEDGVVIGWFTFETAVGRGEGHIRLKDGKCFTLLTSLFELKGFEEPGGVRRPLGAEHGVHRNRKTWTELRADEEATLGVTRDPYCVIVGGGQGGIMLGARLKRLGVPTLILERNERAGDSWRKRYKSLCLHDPVWYDHFPYIPFPDHWPIFSPKDKIADWMEMYAKVMELNYWGSSECKKASYDEAKKEWTVEVIRAGKPVTLRPKQLVLATGMSGIPMTPKFPGMERFTGEQHHSSQHPGPDAYRGKKCVVIGSNNSAHDICASLWEVGADVTMVQRSSTHVSKSDSLMELDLAPLYSEAAIKSGIDHNKADLMYASKPYKIMHLGGIKVCDAIKKRDAAFYKRLIGAGFMHDFGDDDSGLGMKYLRRGSGYYIDVGASELVIEGKIKLKSGPGAAVKEIKTSSVAFADGTELPADLIVYATGYGSMNGWAAKLISQDVADKVGKVWGLGSGTTKDPGPWEGEQRNMWKPTRQDALWFHGGNLHQSRHFSQYLSLQILARMKGIATEVYGLAEVHHRG